jgi:type I restriction enzyme R subunit
MRNNFDISALVKKSNFEFLQEKLPELSALGAFAEKYIYADPSSAAVKLRSFAEKFVDYIYLILNIPFEGEDRDLYHLLINSQFYPAVPKPVVNLLHSIRTIGNTAAHGSNISSNDAVELLKQAYELGKWIFASYCRGDLSTVPDFLAPDRADTSANWEKEKFEILKNLYEKEIQLQSTLLELEQERIKTQMVSESQKEEYVSNGEKVANELKFSEEETRRILIEELLSNAEWKVGKDGEDTDEVLQEFPLSDQPTPTGEGRADY